MEDNNNPDFMVRECDARILAGTTLNSRGYIWFQDKTSILVMEAGPAKHFGQSPNELDKSVLLYHMLYNDLFNVDCRIVPYHHQDKGTLSDENFAASLEISKNPCSPFGAFLSLWGNNLHFYRLEYEKGVRSTRKLEHIIVQDKLPPGYLWTKSLLTYEFCEPRLTFPRI